jgi:dipeptidase E
MKLVFYSGGDENENTNLDKQLLELCSKSKNIQMAFIPSQSYLSDQEFLDFIDQYKKFGVKKFLKLDIDQKFSEALKFAILNSDIIHLGGGNTYYFLKHLKKSGMLKALVDWVQAGGVLSGLSAGAIMMTPNISTAGFPSFDKDDNDEGMKNLKSMNFVNFEFFPHYKNSKRYDNELISYSEEHNRPVYACKDGEGVVLAGDELRFLGKPTCFYQGKKINLY